jgi:hypothetical protein
VEIFTYNSYKKAAYEGQVVADSNGYFVFNKGDAFINPNIVSTATDSTGNTSTFSRLIADTSIFRSLQEGSSLQKFPLLAKPSSQLVSDARLGAAFFSSNIFYDILNLDYLLTEYIDLGAKRLDTSMQEVEEPIDWNRDEFYIHPDFDRFIDDLNNNGIVVNYLLHFWDKEGHANGEVLEVPRFQTDEQIQDFLEYVRFVVSNFKGRIQYYTIWTEPDACGGSQIKCIEVLDYIELASQTIPVIRQEDPQAKVVLTPNVLYFDRDYLFTVIESDVIEMFDVISWHGIYDVIPEHEFFGNYYYEYPLIIEEIKRTASANGFDGEYWGTDLSWCSEEYPSCHDPIGQPWEILETVKQSAKYSARGVVIQLGLDVGVGWNNLESSDQPWLWPTVRNLNTVMAGTTPTNLPVDIESAATNITSYGFTLPNGDILFALWTNGTAVEDDPGVNTTLTFRGLDAGKVVGLDVLYGFEQELITETENGNLIIHDLLVKDYPIILRITGASSP